MESGLAVPDAPADFTAGPGDGTFELHFTAPADNGSSIIRYDYSTDDGSTWQELTGVTGSGSMQGTITHESGGDGTTPLGYNIPYTMRVRAVNGVGPSVQSGSFTATIAPKSPDAPFPAVSVVNGTITLTFNEPRDYGATISGWEYTTNNGMDWKPLTVEGSGSLTATITNQSTGDGATALQAGQTYQVRIHANNSAGMGRDTQTLNVTIPNPGAPGAPGSINAVQSGDNAIDVDFAIPTTGDSAITKYQYSTDDGNSWRDTPTTGDGPLHANLTGDSMGGFPLGHGGRYRVRIRAVNGQGPGLPSDADEVDFPATAPGPPFNPSATPRAEGGFTLSFGRPSDNGSMITAWLYSTDNGMNWKPLSVAGEMQMTATITNQSTGEGTTPLATGVSYQIRIRADNEIGPGENSMTVTASLPIPGSPAAPGSVNAAPAGDNHIGVDFAIPSPGDSPISKYEYSTDNGASWRDIPPASGGGPLHTELTVESNSGFPFARGMEYRVRIRAVNSQGAGMPSDASSVTFPPSAPGKPFNLSAAARAEGGFTLHFGSPPDNGRMITSWEYSTDNGVNWKPLGGVAGEWQLSATITNQSTGDGAAPLAAGGTYQIRIHAVNEIGPGEDSDTVTAALPAAGSPGAPTVVNGGPNGNQIGIDFNAPSPGDSPISKYQYSTDDGATWRDTPTTGDGPLHVDISMESGTGFQLYPGQPYQVRIRAVNGQGPGLPSAATAVGLTTQAPGKAFRVSVVPGDGGGFALSFDNAPDNGSPITSWQYSTDNGGSWKTLGGVSGEWELTATITNQSTGDGTTPLAAGGTYQVRIRAINEVGPGEDSDTVTASLPAAGSPAAPTSLAGGPSADGIGVDFNAPSPGDSAITKYQYSTDDGNTWVDTQTSGGAPLHINITVESDSHFPLRHGDPYRIRVRAVNGQGPGMPSTAFEQGLPPIAPGEPWDLRVELGAGSVTVNFDAPSDNGSEITAWEYTTDDGANWKALTTVVGDWQKSATITNQSTGDGTTPLATGVTYRIRIRAINGQGTGRDSQPVSAALPNAGAPAAPTDVNGTAAGDKIGVNFTAPGQGDSPISKYQYTTDDGNDWSDADVTGSGTLHIDISAESGTDFPLSPGHPYRIRIRAVNAQGPGWPSAADEVGLPPTAPGAPFDIHGEPGDAQFTLTWATSDNGSEITSYEYSTNDGTDWKPLSPVTFNDNDWTTSATVTHQSTGDGSALLQNGQSYQVRLRATNGLGTGSASEPITVELPMPGSPARPADINLSPLDDRIGVDFTAPGQGDSPISKYQYSTDGGNSWADISTTGTTTLHVEIALESGSGMPLGHENRYFVRVRAVNAQGPGQPSDQAEISLPPTKPSKPSAITPTPGDKAVTFDFSVDSDRPLTSVEYSTDNGTSWRTLDNVTELDKMHNRATITTVSTSGGEPLTNGVTYQLRLRATSELGTSDVSDAASFTPGANGPGVPSDVVPTAGDRRITITYTVTNDGGSPITGLRYSTDGGTTWANATATGTGPYTVVITTQSIGDATTPLVNGVAYAVRLLLLNSGGAGLPTGTITVTPITVPAAPGGLTATPAPLSGSLQFTTPDTGGGAINGWEYTTDGGTTWAPLPTPSGTGTLTATITSISGTGRTGLVNGTTYQVAVRARNAAGPGAASSAVALTPRTTAGAPNGFTAAARNHAAALTFKAPSDNGGSAITAYQVSTNNGGSWTTLTTASGEGGTLTATVDGLTNDQPYQVKVRAVNAAGPGTATGAVPVTPLAPPAAPTAVKVTAKTATISVSWTASSAGGAPVTGYTAIASPGPATCDSTPASPTGCVLGAQAGQPYTVTVVAHSASGDSNASLPSDSGTAAAPVIPPTPPPANSPVLDTPAQDDNKTKPGATMTIKGSGYAPNSTVELVVYSTPVSLGTVLTDDNGEFSVDVVVPPSLPIGEHSIAAVGADPQGNARTMRLDVTVAPAVPATPLPTTPPVLAVTGSPTAGRVILGLLMLLAGATLVRVSRAQRWQPRHRSAR